MPTPSFHPPCGPVEAWTDGDVVRATGIPYARAARFERPVPVPDWTAPLRATTWSPACPQPAMPDLIAFLGPQLDHLVQDEHCQQLSVTAPADVTTDERLPVMVWIHGGSYVFGAGDMPCGDPAALVAEQRVVVVAVTYRLGLFGFLGDGGDRPANLGLLDQLEALRWVQRNIAAFGGDPGRVTAFGQSAGADAVAHLMATPGASGLFGRAIIQSPPLGISRDRRAMSAAMASVAADLDADSPVAEVVARQADVAATGGSFGLRGGMPFGTQYGWDPLPAEDAVEAAWDRVAPEIDVLIGYTAQEARLFTGRLPALERRTRVPVLGPLALRAVVRVATEAVYSRSIRRFARRHARAGGRAHTYVVSWSAPGNPLGAAHTIDLPLLFGDEQAWASASLVAGATWPEIHAHGVRVRQLWADFARGVPLPDRGEVPGVLSYGRARPPRVPTGISRRVT